MPYVRNATDIDPASNANVVGMKVDKTLGPFVDSFGVAHWLDLIPHPTPDADSEQDTRYSRVPNRTHRVFIGSDQTRSYSCLREIRSAIEVYRHGLNLRREGKDAKLRRHQFASTNFV